MVKVAGEFWNPSAVLAVEKVSFLPYSYTFFSSMGMTQIDSAVPNTECM